MKPLPIREAGGSGLLPSYVTEGSLCLSKESGMVRMGVQIGDAHVYVYVPVTAFQDAVREMKLPKRKVKRKGAA